MNRFQRYQNRGFTLVELAAALLARLSAPSAVQSAANLADEPVIRMEVTTSGFVPNEFSFCAGSAGKVDYPGRRTHPIQRKKSLCRITAWKSLCMPA